MKTIVLIDSITLTKNYTGKAYKAAGYYGMTRGLHTIQLSVNDFIGRIYIEASLATKPCDDDFFSIYLNGNLPYLEFPVNPTAPLAAHGDTVNLGFSFKVNAIWIRARIDRSYILNPNINMIGTCNKILLSY